MSILLAKNNQEFFILLVKNNRMSILLAKNNNVYFIGK